MNDITNRWSHHIENIQTLTNQLENSFFYYDLDAFERHIKQMQSCPAKLWYAVKANPLSSVIQSLNNQNCRFDVASLGELKQVSKQGVDPSNILNTGPAKSKTQLRTFLELGVRIFVIESEQQLNDLDSLSNELNIKPQVLLRVQLDWSHEKEKNILGGNCLSQFGLPPENWIEAQPSLYKGIDIIGLHIFQWGNILNADKLKSIWQHIVPQLQQLAEKIDINLKVIDLGGGIGIPYSKEEANIAVETVKSILGDIQALCPTTELWLELGRYAIGNYGCYATKIIDRKKAGDTEMLILEGGVNHLLRPGIIDQPFPVQTLSSIQGDFLPMRLHGPLCTSLDCLGTFHLPDNIKAGDWLLFSQCGAYGFTESMPFFLCHDLAGEVIYRNSNTKVIRQPESPSFWMK
jgi:diaminopimelate decarboxylase